MHLPDSLIFRVQGLLLQLQRLKKWRHCSFHSREYEPSAAEASWLYVSHLSQTQAAQQRHCDQCWKSESLLYTCPWKLEAPSKCFFLHLCVTVWYLSPGSGSPKETSQSPCLGLAGLPNVQKSSRGYRVKQSQAVNPQAVGSAAQQAVALHAQDTDAETEEMWEKISVYPSPWYPTESARLSLSAVHLLLPGSWQLPCSVSYLSPQLLFRGPVFFFCWLGREIKVQLGWLNTALHFSEKYYLNVCTEMHQVNET